MSYSKLATVKMLSPNCTKPRRMKIDTITIHHMAGNLSVETCGKLFQRESRQASSNYGIGSDGRIAVYCEEENRSWCSSSGANDHRAITIEVANNSLAPNWTISDEAMSSLIALVTDICARNGIKKLLWKNDKTLIGKVNEQNITLHRWFANTLCPGPYIESKLPYLVEQVNKRLEVENMTKEELKQFIEKTVKEMGRGQEASTWAAEGVQEAMEMGLTDGSNPLAWATRQEVMLMAKRSAEYENE